MEMRSAEILRDSYLAFNSIGNSRGGHHTHLEKGDNALQCVRGIGTLLGKRKTLHDLGASFFGERFPKAMQQVQIFTKPGYFMLRLTVISI